MPSLIEPLSIQVPIVDPKTGTPTPQFQRLLQQLGLASELTNNGGQIGIAGGGIATAMLADNAVTDLKLADMAAKTVKGNKEAASGDPEDLTLSQVLDMIGGATWGDILFRGTAGWQRLAAGAAGKVLQTNGDGADPSWVTAGGGASAQEVTPTKPLAANFTLDNGGTGGTLADATYGLLVTRTSAAGDQMSVARFNTVPSASAFTLTAKIKPLYTIFGTTQYSNCLFLRNSTNGRLIAFGDYQGGQDIVVQNWNSYSSFNGNVLSTAGLVAAWWPWRRITLAAGTLSFLVSPDGDAWITLATTTVAAFLTASGGGSLDQVGFGVRNGLGACLCNSWTLV